MEKDIALTAPCPAAQNVRPLWGRMREFQLGAGIGVSTVKSLAQVHKAQGSMRRDWSPPSSFHTGLESVWGHSGSDLWLTPACIPHPGGLAVLEPNSFPSPPGVSLAAPKSWCHRDPIPMGGESSWMDFCDFFIFFLKRGNIYSTL